MKNLKRFLCLILCLALAFSFAACGNKDDGNTDDDQVENNGEELTEEEAWKLEPAYGQPIRYMIGAGCSSGPAVADLKGFFAEEGLTGEAVRADNDVDALGTHQVDINVGHIAKQFVPATNGVDIVFVGGAHSGCKTLYVLADSEYQTLEDLKGTKISTPNGIGKSDYNITARLFIADGIDPMNEVTLTPVDVDACVPAMQNGEIAAALLSDTYGYALVNQGLLRPIRSMLDEDLNQLCCVITMNGTFARENPITARKAVTAVKKAHKWLAENPEEGTAWMIENNLNTGDLDMNIEINKSMLYAPTNEFAEEQLRLIAADYLEYGLMTTSDDVDTIMEKYWMPMVPEIYADR